jgi:uncharacterized repeat protein (TIGR01451 family)
METREQKGRVLSAVVLALAAIAAAIPFSSSALPLTQDNMDGTHTVTWDFADPDDYLSTGITIQNGEARLSYIYSSWITDALDDFAAGTTVNLSAAAPGRLELEVSPVTELVRNGNFTDPANGISQPSATNWTHEESGTATSHVEIRNNTRGFQDNGYCWRNYHVDANPGAGYSLSIWVNQTFNITSMPLTLDVSAFHRFVNHTHEASPGMNASLVLSNLGAGQSHMLATTGWQRSTDPDYVGFATSGIQHITGPGLYNISLLTMFDTTADPSTVTHIPAPAGLYDYWDNVSVACTAHRPAGEFLSRVYDAGSYAMWRNVSWVETLPPATDIELLVRTGNSSVPTDSIWSDWSSPMTTSGGASVESPWGRYIQYKALFTTGSTNLTPVLHQVNLSYEKFALVGTLETHDLLPAAIESWGYFEYLASDAGQVIAYQYSTDSGNTWSNIVDDIRDLRAVPITPSGLRLRATLATTNTIVTPTLRSMSITYTSSNPRMTLEPYWEFGGASPGEVARLHVLFNNTAASRSTTAWLNVYLDEGLTYISNNSFDNQHFDSYVSDSNPANRKFVFSDIPGGSYEIWVDAAVRPGTHDGEHLKTTVTLEYLGPLGTRVESLLSTATLRVDGPLLTAELVALNATGDVGDVINYAVHVNNTGRGDATKAWVNATLDDRLRGENLTHVIENLSAGSEAVIPFNVTLGDNVVQGSVVNMDVSVSYADSSGYVRSTGSGPVPVAAALRSSFSLALGAPTHEVRSGDMVLLTVYFNNTGHGSATLLSMSLDIPAGLEFVSSSEECLVSGGRCYWTLEDVGPGPRSFTLTMRALVMHDPVFSTGGFSMSMRVTDQVDGLLPEEVSNSLSIDIIRIYTFWERIYWPWSGIAAAGATTVTALGLWYVFRPIPPSIDDAFVMYKDGRLIAHRRSKAKPRSELDGDLVGAMLTAVQQFVSDSLSEGGEGKVKRLEFGDRELYLERGAHINIALIYTGSMNRKLQGQVKELASKIEGEHPELQNWDGRMTRLGDIGSQVDSLVDAWQQPK